VDICLLASLLDFFLHCVWLPKADITSNGRVEESWLLAHKTNLVAIPM
jgi:hypothetical protein